MGLMSRFVTFCHAMSRFEAKQGFFVTPRYDLSRFCHTVTSDISCKALKSKYFWKSPKIRMSRSIYKKQIRIVDRFGAVSSAVRRGFVAHPSGEMDVSN
jgi:hypothetical protein